MSAIYLLTIEQDNGGFGVLEDSQHSTAVLTAHNTWNAARTEALWRAKEFGCSISRENWRRDGDSWKHHLVTSDEDEYVWLQITKMPVYTHVSQPRRPDSTRSTRVYASGAQG